MSDRRLSQLAPLAVLSIGALSTAVARAQSVGDELGEVVVTATRFPAAALDYAGSSTRLGAADISARGATHYADLLNLVPGVQIQRGSGQEGLIAIRSPVLTGAGACGAFLMLEDGLPLRPTGFCNVNDLFEVNTEQASAVEVLRGPGSAAYGANAVHGIVNVLSRSPRDMAAPGIAARWGQSDLQQIAADWRTELTNERSAGLYGLWRHDGGFRAASGTDEGKLNAVWRQATARGAWTWRAAGTVLNQETAGFIRGFDSYRDRALARSNPNPEAFRDAWSARTNLSYESQPCTGCANSAYLLARSSGMEFLQHFLLGKPLEQNRHVSLGAGAQWRRPFGDENIWQFGFDAGRMQVALTESQSGPTLEGSAAARAIRPAGRHYDYRVAGTTLAVNGGFEYLLGERQRLGAQLRLESTQYDYDNRMAAGNLTDAGVSCGFGGCLYNRPADRRDRFDDLSTRLEWQYRLTRGQWYLAAARGFRPPETVELYRLQRGQDVAALDSEQLTSVETGLRWQQDNWRVALAAYWQRKTNVLLRDANGFNIDGGRTRHRGIEYDLTKDMGRGWSAQLTGSWAIHRYDFDRTIDGGEVVVRGTDMDTAPRHLARFELRRRDANKIEAALRAEFVDAYNVDASGLRRYPGHAVVGAWVGGQLTSEQSLFLRIDNLFDRRYADRADFAQGEYRYFPAAGRRIMLDYTWRRR